MDRVPVDAVGHDDDVLSVVGQGGIAPPSSNRVGRNGDGDNPIESGVGVEIGSGWVDGDPGDA